jgi:hypothetical protein
LHMLRMHILGGERFDAAFRAYIDRWAFNIQLHGTSSEQWRVLAAKI